MYALYGALKQVHMARPRPTSRTHKKAFAESTLAAQKATLIIKSWLEESCLEGTFDTADLKRSIAKAVSMLVKSVRFSSHKLDVTNIFVADMPYHAACQSQDALEWTALHDDRIVLKFSETPGESGGGCFWMLWQRGS